MNKVLFLYAGSNLVGLVLYVCFVRSIQHQIQMEERAQDFGDSLNLLATAVPVLLFFIAWNGAWAVVAFVKVRTRREYRLAVWCAGGVLAWVATILIVRQLA